MMGLTEFMVGYLVCRLRLLQHFRQGIWSADGVRLLQNFRQGMWSADSDYYKTSGRVPGLQTELDCCKTSGRVSGLQTENAKELWTGYLLCRLRLLQNFRVGGLRTEIATKLQTV